MLGGLDALVLTGGVGEHDPDVARRLCEGLAHVGVPTDLREAPPGEDAVIGPAGAAVTVLRVHAREDVQVADEVDALLPRRR